MPDAFALCFLKNKSFFFNHRAEFSCRISMTSAIISSYKKKSPVTLSLYTLTSGIIFSFCSLSISYVTNKDNLFHNQKFLKLVIISFILMTFTFDLRMML